MIRALTLRQRISVTWPTPAGQCTSIFTAPARRSALNICAYAQPSLTRALTAVYHWPIGQLTLASLPEMA
jgi:hypothetical protein